MKAVNHPSNNRTIGSYMDRDASGAPVEPCGVTDAVLRDQLCMVMFFQPSRREIEQIQAGYPIALVAQVLEGTTMPPVALMPMPADMGGNLIVLPH